MNLDKFLGCIVMVGVGDAAGVPFETMTPDEIQYLELIGYDESNGGVVIESETSINYLTKKKIEKVNTNEKAEGGDEVFKETISKIKTAKLTQLSAIKDFDELRSIE